MHWIGSENKVLWATNPRRLLHSHMINTLYYELNPQSRRQSQLRVWGFPLNLVRLRIRTLWIAISETSSEIHFIQMLLVTVLAQRGNLNPELTTVWRIWSMSLNIHEGSIVRMEMNQISSELSGWCQNMKLILTFCTDKVKVQVWKFLEEMASLEDKTTSPIDNVDQDVHRQDYYWTFREAGTECGLKLMNCGLRCVNSQNLRFGK